MPKRLPVLGLSAAVLMTALLGCAREPGPPNIVVFVLDTVRADAVELDAAGPPITPHLRDLAREGVTFTSAFTHTTWTKPAIATLFTSRFPAQHTVRNVVSEGNGKLVAGQLPPEMVTLAERLQAGGYYTAAIINQTHLQAKFGFGQGFAEFEAYQGKTSDRLNEILRKSLEQRTRLHPIERARPVFLYIHYLDPHWPYLDLVEEVAPALGSTTLTSEPPGSGRLADEWFERGLSEDERLALHARYRHGVAAVDRAMGEALDHLDRSGLLEDAVVVVTSDHGEGFGEHGRFLHGFAPYEEVHRIPLVVRLPERLRGEVREVSALVGLVDILPTLVEFAGVRGAEGDMGRSLIPLMQGVDRAWSRPIFSETESVRSLRTVEQKLIAYPDGRLEFFDLVADPGEQYPLPCEESCDALAEQLARLTDLVESSGSPEEVAVELDAEDRKNLEALGYLNN